MLSLLGLKDDYVADGRLLREALTGQAVPAAVKASGRFLQLSQYYEQVNAPFGQFAMDTLKASTAALASTDDAKYNSIENTIASLTSQRDSLAARMRSALNAAAFDGQAISNSQAGDMVSQAKSLLRPQRSPPRRRRSTSKGSSSRHAPGSSPSRVRPA